MSHDTVELVSRTHTTGKTRHLILLHGWGINSAAFSAFIPLLQDALNVTTIDLPGYGDNADAAPTPYTLATLTDVLGSAIPEGSIVAGWSLGGLLAQSIARHRHDLAGVITLASTPRFVAGAGWPGIAPDVLAMFATSLEQDYKKTIERFLAIQAMGSTSAKQDIKRIKTQLADATTPCLHALREGLTLLGSEDLRNGLHQIKVPTLRVYGRRDTLVPVTGIDRICELHPDSDTVVLPNASHAPFISHPEHTANVILRFIATL